MNKTMKKLLFLSLLAVSIAACSRRSDGGDARLKSAADSVAYVIGMNVGLNLQRMDSTLNVAALCEGIRDVFREKTRFTTDEAEAFYLRYMNYTLPEEARAYEERFLADIADRNRSYARTKSGVTYSVEQIGDQERIPASERDSVLLRLRILRADGEPLYSSYDRGDTLRRMLGDLKPGVQEALRLIGEEGRITAWVPAEKAYGAAGEASMGIAPNSTLCFEIELVRLDKYAEWNRRRN